MLYNTVLFIDKVNQLTYIYYTKDYVTACNFISQMKCEIQHDWVEGKDFIIKHGSEIEFSDVFIEEECMNIQPGVYLLCY